MTPEQVKLVRERLKMDQAEFAVALGVTQATVSRWEQGTRPISKTAEILLRRIAAERKVEIPKK